ncbi:MAG: class II aldolase/adducin family protein [Firmicutes bacterium]|nr:class II aldolase/adducin family protein [Bacillota bacterium]
MQYEALRNEMVQICRDSFEQGLFAGTSGNLSVYVDADEVMLCTPTSVRYETMKPEDIVALKLDGTILEGHYKPTSEWQMHAEIYRQMPHIGAVFHTHSPYATSFAVVNKKIPYILIEMAPFLGGDVPCARFALPGTRELGVSAVEALTESGRNGCLLANHGVLAIGDNLAQARIRAEYVEDAAKIYHHALQVGTPTILE